MAARLRVDTSEIKIRVERTRELWQATHLLEGNHIQITLVLQVGGWARGLSPLLVKIEWLRKQGQEFLQLISELQNMCRELQGWLMSVKAGMWKLATGRVFWVREACWRLDVGMSVPCTRQESRPKFWKKWRTTIFISLLLVNAGGQDLGRTSQVQERPSYIGEKRRQTSRGSRFSA